MNKVIVYHKGYCPFCHRAMALLDSKNIVYTTIDVENDADQLEEMIQKSGRHTVPQIFINGQHIGGCDDLHALDADGKLNSLS